MKKFGKIALITLICFVAIFWITIETNPEIATKLGFASEHGKPVEIINTIDGDLMTYYELSNGTWRVNEQTYQYRLEISGRMPNAAVDSTFVYLSNLENITFEQAWKAAGLSSNMDDYFTADEAVLVEWINK